MRIARLFFSVSAILMLSACSTAGGVGPGLSRMGEWIEGKGEHFNATAPKSYTGQNKRGVLKPPGMGVDASSSANVPLEQENRTVSLPPVEEEVTQEVIDQAPVAEVVADVTTEVKAEVNHEVKPGKDVQSKEVAEVPASLPPIALSSSQPASSQPAVPAMQDDMSPIVESNPAVRRPLGRVSSPSAPQPPSNTSETYGNMVWNRISDYDKDKAGAKGSTSSVTVFPLDGDPSGDQAGTVDDLRPVALNAPVENSSALNAPEKNIEPADPKSPALGTPTPNATAYNQDVSVFPIDGDASGFTPTYTTNVYSYVDKPEASVQPSSPLFDYGQMVSKFYFAHGSSRLDKKEKKELNKFADGLKRTQSPINVTVVGHASKRVDGIKDPIKKKMVNFEMAQKRANSVTVELTKSGVQPDWVKTVSKGDEEPATDVTTKSQEEADRRVELFMDN